MENLRRQLRRFSTILIFTPLEWTMIVLSGVSVSLDIYVALLLRDGLWGVAFPLLVFSIFLTAIAQGVWTKVLRNMTDRKEGR